MRHPKVVAKTPKTLRGLCATKFCRNRRLTGRLLCAKCRSRVYKQRHPLKYHFNLLRCNAKTRGKTFSLTFDQYYGFCEQTGLHENRGVNPFSLTIDRIDSSKGYHADNIRALTHYANSCKQDNDDYDETVPDDKIVYVSKNGDPF